MKKILKILALILFVGFVVIQLFRPDFTNPPVNQAETLQTATQVPDNVQAILKRSCADCHSNETVYPWYSQIAPSSWFLADHIHAGRSELNFSTWNTLEKRRKTNKLEEICEMVEARAMPLPSYLWIHWSAKLSDDEIRVLCDWTKAEKARLESAQ